MPKILVVDNCKADQEHLERLFSKDATFVVRSAFSLEEMVNSMRAESPDLLIVDPTIPGREANFVKNLRKEFPLIPAIIVTTAGNEELAITALKSGAASYVPKHLLDEELLTTVRDVLDVSNNQRCLLRMLDQMCNFQCTFVLQSDRALLAPLVGYLQEHFLRLGIVEESDVTRVGIALDEALTNALFHGNFDLNSDLREQDNDSYHRLAAERSQTQPYSDRRLFVEVAMNQESARVTITDEGKGFDPSSLPDPTDPANLERVSGRGVLLMRTFMDEIKYNERGNSVTMIKNRCSEKAPTC